MQLLRKDAYNKKPSSVTPSTKTNIPNWIPETKIGSNSQPSSIQASNKPPISSSISTDLLRNLYSSSLQASSKYNVTSSPRTKITPSPTRISSLSKAMSSDSKKISPEKGIQSHFLANSWTC